MVLINLNLIILSFLFQTIKLTKAELYKPNIPIRCSINKHCPPEWPCCSPYGECGAGPMCVGGCNPKFSFNDDSCIPSHILFSPLTLQFDRNSFPKNTIDIEKKKTPLLIRRYSNNERYHNLDMAPIVDTTNLNDRMELHKRGLFHHTNYLVTNSEVEAKEHSKMYNFIYSGSTSIDPNLGDIVLGMPKRTTGSQIASTKQFLYGKAKVRMRTGRSRGVVTGLVLISQVGDEIDFEFLGSELNSVQSNYYYQGELIHTRMQRFFINTDIWANYHDYEIDWNQERIQWIVDGHVVRTLFKRDTWDGNLRIFKYPQTPMRLEIAIWPGGAETNAPGTISWAGGLIDWENSPDILEKGQFSAQIQYISITPYENQFRIEVNDCIQRIYGPNRLNRETLSHITFSYNKFKDPSYTSNALELYCHLTPRVNGWTSSGNNFDKKCKKYRQIQANIERPGNAMSSSNELNHDDRSNLDNNAGQDMVSNKAPTLLNLQIGWHIFVYFFIAFLLA
ncbi:putative glycosylase NDAI_0D00720 [Naumovozyma dairenensis CBS 421]|uniref:GH16 domain-containing protein n=1 Tax=Naumovozyma dairenensis (strain ATCC 10597 / BCRC 20456 / CBS 421 / NBRC 0211 / NRRL Y-12639) TaxID=1071378 RepID=G0W9C5_NAUDC|nr:hypothetical protein NDAI_0D00720 [Naumovozyma dairenensis CBS 421]CCD24386.1 hypothetical protein NDAI_0D00720 [Naumovozyma dairenensis CBS 421]